MSKAPLLCALATGLAVGCATAWLHGHYAPLHGLVASVVLLLRPNSQLEAAGDGWATLCAILQVQNYEHHGANGWNSDKSVCFFDLRMGMDNYSKLSSATLIDRDCKAKGELMSSSLRLNISADGFSAAKISPGENFLFKYLRERAGGRHSIVSLPLGERREELGLGAVRHPAAHASWFRFARAGAEAALIPDALPPDWGRLPLAFVSRPLHPPIVLLSTGAQSEAFNGSCPPQCVRLNSNGPMFPRLTGARHNAYLSTCGNTFTIPRLANLCQLQLPHPPPPLLVSLDS